MLESTTSAEITGDRRGKIAAVAGFILFVLLLLVPLFFTTLPKPGQPGILVNLGQIDLGQGSENAPAPAKVVPPQPDVTPQPDPIPEPQPEVTPPPPPEAADPDPAPVRREVVVTETPQEIAIRKQKEREEARKKAEADRRRRAEAEADRQRRAEADAQRRRERAEADERRRREEAAEAKRRAEAEAAAQRQAEAEATRQRVAGLFGEGGGRGDTGQAGNQGRDNGDPNADRLTGVSTGDGRVSGGLGGRGVLRSPVVKENSQTTGTVVIKVCVDPSGKIASAEFTQRGTTTSDPNLRSAALSNARQWAFEPNPAAPASQCGFITYDFKVQ